MDFEWFYRFDLLALYAAAIILIAGGAEIGNWIGLGSFRAGAEKADVSTLASAALGLLALLNCVQLFHGAFTVNLCCGLSGNYGLQPLYFRDSELARRGRIPAEAAQTKNAGTLLTPEALPRLP